MYIEHIAMYVNDLEKTKEFFICLAWLQWRFMVFMSSWKNLRMGNIH